MRGCYRATTSTAIYKELFELFKMISNAVAVANLTFYFIYQAVRYATAFLSSGSSNDNSLNPFDNLLLPLFWSYVATKEKRA